MDKPTINSPISPDLISNAFEDFISSFSSTPPDDQVKNILRLAFYSGAAKVFSELLPLDRITALHTELVNFANNPMREKVY